MSVPCTIPREDEPFPLIGYVLLGAFGILVAPWLILFTIISGTISGIISAITYQEPRDL